MFKIDVVFILTNSDIIFRVNDNIAANEDEAEEVAAEKLLSEFGINIKDHRHMVDFPYTEEVE